MESPILIVEDDKAVRESLRMLLETYGYAVEEFASGEALLSYRDLAGGGCVILDLVLPGASGLETLERLRARKVGLPVVVISGRVGRGARAAAERLDAAAFFDKPINTDALLSTLRRLVP